jgi:hypothetical protein
LNSADELLQLYEELHALSQKAQNSLQGGLDLTVLTPLFDRKAVLNAQIDVLGVPDRSTDPALLNRLLEAQTRAAQAEAALVQTLQPIVSSNEINSTKGRAPSEGQTGKKWDLSG